MKVAMGMGQQGGDRVRRGQVAGCRQWEATKEGGGRRQAAAGDGVGEPSNSGRNENSDGCGLCSNAREEHARELPLMNGIREDIKSMGVLDPCTPASQEAMANIASRLKVLQEKCEAHFAEEERELLPLLEAAEMRGGEQEEVLGRCLEEVMQSTHTSLIEFFMDGLTPREAVQYLWLVAKCCDRRWATAILQSLTTSSSEGSLLQGLAWDPQKNT